MPAKSERGIFKMDEQKNEMEKKPNVVEIAKKKRHLYLYEKLHSGTPLTPAELRELEKFEEVDSATGVVDTKEKVAKALKVSVRTVYYWEKDGMPTTPEGNYDLLDIKAWRMTRQRHKDLSDSEKDKWDIAYRRNKALLLEIEYQKVLGSLIPKEEVEEGRVARILMVKREFLALPQRLAPVLAMKEPREICAILEEAICEIIDDFAGVRETKEGDEGNEPK
jgi:phage terminase Nu1 subunit (DNA packaging protein)